jgi:hypothetical protein
VQNALSTAPEAASIRLGEIVPAEILAPPMRHERRWLLRDECALVLDGFLRRLARQEALCRRVLGRIAGSFLRRGAHHRLGFARLGDYTRERLGLSAREVQSLAQVMTAVERLRQISAAFENGGVSWAQLRLLASRATPETEDRWLLLARGRTVRALEASCMESAEPGFDEGQGDVEACEQETPDGEPRVRFRVSCPRRVASSWRRTVELARRVAGEELSVWQAAEAIAAEALSGVERDQGGGYVDGLGEGEALAPPARPADDQETREVFSQIDWPAVEEAIPQAVEDLAEGLDSADAFALDERMRAVIGSMQRVDWQLGRLLRLFLDMRLHLLMGFPSSARYVRERLGMSSRKGRSLVHLERRSARAPELASAYRAGEISWARALAILPVIGEHAARWIERAQSVTFRRLADEVDWAIEARDAGVSFQSIAPPPLGAVLVKPERQTCARSESGDGPALECEVAFWGPASVVSLFRAAVGAFAGPSAPAWLGLEKLLDHVTDAWMSQPRHRDPVFARDGWRCAVPGCSSRRNLHDHHVLFRSRGGDNGRDNRVAVCAWHHLRGLHAATIRAHGRAPTGITWEVGARRDHPPLLRLHGDCYTDG